MAKSILIRVPRPQARKMRARARVPRRWSAISWMTRYASFFIANIFSA